MLLSLESKSINVIVYSNDEVIVVREKFPSTLWYMIPCADPGWGEGDGEVLF